MSGDRPGAVSERATFMSTTQQGWEGAIKELLGQIPALESQRCPYCGTPLAPDAQSCPGCGESLNGLLDMALHESYFREAYKQFAQGDRAQALETLSLCLTLRPDYGPGLGLKAGLLALNGRLADAEAVIERALARMPHDAAMANLEAAIAQCARESRLRGALLQASRPAPRQKHVKLERAQKAVSDRSAQRWRIAVASALTGAGLAALTHWMSRHLARGETDRLPRG